MEANLESSRKYYEQSLSRPHYKRTERANELNKSALKTAIECGCGTGSDIKYLAEKGYKVFGFDINPDSVAICRERFDRYQNIHITESSFENFTYPKSDLIIANASLFFAEPEQFEVTWQKIQSALVIGGVFAGDFMGVNDSWATNFRCPTTALTESNIRDLFTHFDVIEFNERDEDGLSAIGVAKHWHIYSVVAVKRT